MVADCATGETKRTTEKNDSKTFSSEMSHDGWCSQIRTVRRRLSTNRMLFSWRPTTPLTQHRDTTWIVKLTSQDQVSDHTVEQTVAVPAPQIQGRFVEVPKVIPQECVQQSRRLRASSRRKRLPRCATGSGKVGSELGEEGVIMGASKDVWQIVENLREELKRLEEEIRQRFPVLTQVNYALTHLALSTHERADFLKNLVFRSVTARREPFLTQFGSRICNDGEQHRSTHDFTGAKSRSSSCTENRQGARSQVRVRE